MSTQAVRHLQSAIQAKTISHSDRSLIDFNEYEKFIAFLKDAYPMIHKKATLERVENYSLLFHFKGATDLDPIGLMGHYDVVPVREEGWQVPPFSADIVDGYMFGRGTLDMKGHVIALLEAMEDCLNDGLVLQRDVYIMLGHNEETGIGMPDSGAVAIKRLLESRQVHFNMVIDEGGAFIDGKGLSIDGPIALIGVCEKGYVDVELIATQTGGHASMPPETSALYEVFEAAMKMEKDKFKSELNQATDDMFKALVPYMKQPKKFIFKHRSLFKSLILKALIKSPELAATVRTTSVMTMAEGSKAPNVLAQTGRVNINCRIVPGDTSDQVLTRIKNRINSKLRIVAHNATEPTIVSPSDNNQFKLIKDTMSLIYPELKAIAPYLMVAATDSRIYHDMSDGVYRVQPFKNMLWDRGTLHADNERIELESFIKGIRFFKEIIINGSKVSTELVD